MLWFFSTASTSTEKDEMFEDRELHEIHKNVLKREFLEHYQEKIAM